MYTQLQELNIYSFMLLKTVSVRMGKKIQLMTTIPMNKILGKTMLGCKLFFGNFTNKSRRVFKQYKILNILTLLYHISFCINKPLQPLPFPFDSLFQDEGMAEML